MKRAYTKPDILFESFSLSTSIAGNCAVPTNLPAPGQCGLAYGWRVIFLDSLHGCNKTFPKELGNDVICYDNPSESNNLFRS
jgi:hypothetical protein